MANLSSSAILFAAFAVHVLVVVVISTQSDGPNKGSFNASGNGGDTNSQPKKPFCDSVPFFHAAFSEPCIARPPELDDNTKKPFCDSVLLIHPTPSIPCTERPPKPVNATVTHDRAERSAKPIIPPPTKANSTGPTPPPSGPVGFNSTTGNVTRSFDDDDMEDEMRR